MFSITPLLYDHLLQETTANIRINLIVILPETRVIGLGYIFVAESRPIGLSSFKCSWLAPKDACVLKHECIIALQSHRRPLILAPIETAYATSYWSSVVTSVLSCLVPPFHRYCMFSAEKSDPTPISPEFWGVTR